jgi:hypothetical protein
MATWHQQQRPVRLYHDEKWTVLTDPPRGLTVSSLFNSEAEAAQFIESLKKHQPEQAAHSYILPPANSYQRSM